MKTTRLSLTLLAVLAAATLGCSDAPSSNGPKKTIAANTNTDGEKPDKESIKKPNKESIKKPNKETKRETKKEFKNSKAALDFAQRNKIGPRDWNQWAGSPRRNNTPQGENIPTFWKVVFDPECGQFTRNGITETTFINGRKERKLIQLGDLEKKIPELPLVRRSQNIKWAAKVGSQTYGNTVVANGQVYVGTNNGAGYIRKYPKETDLGCLLCFLESDGQFLWQHSNEKLPQGRVVDWQLQGVCDAPLVQGDRLWYVSNRGEVVCLDTNGFYDNENDGPYKSEPADLRTKSDADVVWAYDMLGELGLFQHNMCACSVTAVGDLLFVNTSNGVDESHKDIPSPDCPSFICLDKNTGKLIWSDKSPGLNILHGQWSSPSSAVLGGVPQVIFAGGDGWVYSFKADRGKDGKPQLLWKFDANPKRSKWRLSGRGTRNNIISTPVIYKEKIFVCVGQDPTHGTAGGHLWCIDPAKKLDGSDVSPELVVDEKGAPIPHRRLQAALPGDDVIPNPDSAAVWHYTEFDQNGDGMIDFEEQLSRSVGTVAIKDDILVLADLNGLVHCLDARTGKPYWTYDMLASSWGSALIVDGHIYIGDEDGDLSVFKLSADPNVAMQEIEIKNSRGEVSKERYPINAVKVVYYEPSQDPETKKIIYKQEERVDLTFMDTSVVSTPVVANNVLFISTKSYLFAISPGGK